MWETKTLFRIALLTVFLMAGNSVWAQRTGSAGGGPRLYESRTFQIYTDLSEVDARELLKDLETMIELVSKYFGHPCRKRIQMFVVEDLSRWSPEERGKMLPEGLTSIQGGAGLTVTRVQQYVGGPKIDADAVVFAVSKHQTPMHEAIHAYCGLTFGSTGPVWYSEGMAEVGKYFQAGEKGVNAPPYVIEYLKSEEPKPLDDIVNNPLERTGDSWQNYAWRWVLCHLLGYNENYSQRFKPLGLAMMAGNNTGFNNAYGTQFREIEFEYQLFLQDLEPGYRADLCGWDWKTRFRPLVGAAQLACKVDAQRGWQASRAKCVAGEQYVVSATGEWSTGPDSSEGNGQLVGIIFQDYVLGEPFPIPDGEPFTAPSDGQLYLRCQDDWGKLTDNQGSKTVRIKLAK
ncbi:MAG: hypothetical protein KDA80_02240 [Planctomycetaceae bacterium]|nr:hypothetical protein [Planctomycetaceae bacterium]